MNRRKALITGASRGIGKAIAGTFAKAGYDLYLTCHTRKEELEEFSKELEKEYNIACRCYCFPISEESGVREMFENIPELDVLVNNAGISYIGLLTEMSYEEWKEVIDTNLGGCFLTCKYAITGMISRKRGKIINISSVWGCCGASCEVAYSATKGGINAFTQALAKELAPSNIQVNAVACGAIDTEMNAFLSEADRIALTEEIPSGRFGRPEEVAELVLDLAQKHSYLTGQIIRLDGGWI